MKTIPPTPPERCVCGAIADVMDDETGELLCAHCWLTLEETKR